MTNSHWSGSLEGFAFEGFIDCGIVISCTLTESSEQCRQLQFPCEPIQHTHVRLCTVLIAHNIPREHLIWEYLQKLDSEVFLYIGRFDDSDHGCDQIHCSVSLPIESLLE